MLNISSTVSRLALTTWLVSAVFVVCSWCLVIPRPQNAAVVAFLDQEFELSDLAGEDDLDFIDTYASLRTDIKGPFGQNNSCWGISKKGSSICYYHPTPILRTTALYVYTPATRTLGPILYRDNYFMLNYNKQDLEFKGLKTGYGVEKLSVVKDYIVPNNWTFVAFTDDGSQTKVYNEEGSLVQTLASFEDYQYDNDHVILGANYGSAGWIYMQKTDAFACLYVYDAVLSGEEIRQIPSSCKFKGNPPLETTSASTSTSTTTTTSTATTEIPDETVWPQKEHLLGLWPLSSKYGSADISGNELVPTEPAEVNAFTIGPHGNGGTAVVATKTDSAILKIENSILAPLDGSFTVAMWFSPQSDKQPGALFEFLDPLGTSRAFQFHYNGSNIEIRANGFLVGRFSMVQPSGTWTFFAVTLENHQEMNVYGDHGMFARIQECSNCANSMEFNTGGMALGHSARWDEFVQFGDALSCFVIYNTALDDAEIRQVKEGCRIANSVALSGQPRLPLSPLPDVTHPTTPKIPHYGQFPWIGSLQFFGKHICSATIINSFWVLTSATCVLENNSPSNYNFKAATHDLELSYDQQQQVGIKSISVSGNQWRDLALLKLAEPLSMTSDYINDAYVARGGEMYANWRKEQIFVGWGINGRSEFDSETLPRYVSGLVLTDDRCEKMWADEYDAAYDYCFSSFIEDQNVPCHGDEGSPVLVQTDGDVDAGMGERLLQVGVYRRRDADCSMLKPGIFTRTAPFADWIAGVVDNA